MMTRSASNESFGARIITMGCTEGVYDAAAPSQETQTNSPVALGITSGVVSVRRTASRSKVTRAASCSHAIACREKEGTRPIAPVVQYGLAPSPMTGGPMA